jgi:hypothetical protein
MNKLFDLRFVIGTFFLVVGILLLLYGFFAGTHSAQSLNRLCGGGFVVFGLLMIMLSFQKPIEQKS